LEEERATEVGIYRPAYKPLTIPDIESIPTHAIRPWGALGLADKREKTRRTNEKNLS